MALIHLKIYGVPEDDDYGDNSMRQKLYGRLCGRVQSFYPDILRVDDVTATFVRDTFSRFQDGEIICVEIVPYGSVPLFPAQKHTIVINLGKKLEELFPDTKRIAVKWCEPNLEDFDWISDEPPCA